LVVLSFIKGKKEKGFFGPKERKQKEKNQKL
jgi:hypothetical protein